LIFVDLHDRAKVFRGQDGSRLRQPYALDSSVLAEIENDGLLASTGCLLRERLGVTPDFNECNFCRAVARLASRRSVRLYACGIAALVQKLGMEQPHVAADGSVSSKYPGLPQRAMEALKEILGVPQDSDDPVRFVPAVDGSSVGAAVIATNLE
jgi:hexokinase